MAAVVEAKAGEENGKKNSSEIPDAAAAPKQPNPLGPKPPKAPPPARLLAARQGFDGLWIKEGTSTQFTIEGEKVIWPDGNIHTFINLGSGKCHLSMHNKDGKSVSFNGSFACEDKVTWDNGSVWERWKRTTSSAQAGTEQKESVSGVTNRNGVPAGGGTTGVQGTPAQAWSLWGRPGTAASATATAATIAAAPPKIVAPPVATTTPTNLHAAVGGSSSSAPAPATSSKATVSNPTPHDPQAALKPLAGTWKKVGTSSRYRIEGCSLHWLDSGTTYKITPHFAGDDPQFPGCPRFLANIEGNAFVATLRGAQKLVWSNGGEWQREADLYTPPGAWSSTPVASKTTTAAAGDASSKPDEVASPSAPSKPTVVHGKDGEEIGKRIDQLLGQIGKVEGCERVPRPRGPPAVDVNATSPPTPPPPAPPPAASTAPAATNTATVPPGWPGTLTGQYATVSPGLRPVGLVQHGGVPVGVGYAAAYQQVAAAQQAHQQAQQTYIAQQAAAQQAAAQQAAAQQAAAHHMATLVAGNVAAQAAAQASNAAATAARASTAAPAPVSSVTPAPPTTPGPPMPTASPAVTSAPVAKETKAHVASNTTSPSKVSAAESVGGSLSSWREDVLKNPPVPNEVGKKKLTAKEAEAAYIKKFEDTSAKEAEKKKEPAKVKDKKDSKPKAKEQKDVKAKEKETKTAKEGKAREKDVKAKVSRSKSRNRSRSRGVRKPRRGTSKSRDRKSIRSVKRSVKRTSKNADKHRRRSPSSKSAKKNRGRDSSRNKKRKKKSKSNSSSPKRSRSPVMPFVPRQLLGNVDFKSQGGVVFAASASKAVPPKPSEGSKPVSKSAPPKPAQGIRSEASAAAAAKVLELLEMSGADDFGVEQPSQKVPKTDEPPSTGVADKPEPSVRLVVSGGLDKEMGETLSGTYVDWSTNHGRTVYKRVDSPDEKALLYFWDDRDGEDAHGWWFGPEVGGEDVWARNSNVEGGAIPPKRGWKVLHSGAEDPTLTVKKEEAKEEDDSSDDVVWLLKGRWRLEVTDSEDELETCRDVRGSEERGLFDADEVSTRLAALCKDVSLPARNSPTEDKESPEEALDDDDDDMEDDAGPLPEISELRARAQAIGGEHETSSSTQDGKVGRPPVVADGDRRRDQLGVVEEALSMDVQDQQVRAPSEDKPRVRVTSTTRTGVNLVEVVGFCAAFGEIVAMRMEGSGAEACAIIEYKDGAAALACVNQRKSEALHVVLCDD